MQPLPFEHEPLPPRSLFGGFSTQARNREAFVQAKNHVIDGCLDRIKEVVSSAGDPAIANFLEEWTEFLSQVFEHFAKDLVFDNEERLFLKQTIAALHLPREIAEAAFMRGRVRVLRARVRDTLQNAHLVEDDVIRNERLALGLQLDTNTIKRVYSEEAHIAVEARFAELTRDGCASPQAVADFRAFMVSARIQLRNEADVNAVLEHSQRRWQLLFGELETVDSPVNLRKNETAYLVGTATWFEYRVAPALTHFVGVTKRVRLAQGLSFRLGSTAFARGRPESLIEIERGTIVLTNQRLVLVGQRSGKTLTWRDALEVRITALNEIEVIKGKGRSPTIRFDTCHNIPLDLSVTVAWRLAASA